LDGFLMAHDGPPNPVHHVADSDKHWSFFESLFGGVDVSLPVFNLFGHEFRITKFMILEVLAAVLIVLIFVPLARKARNGALPRGRWWNAFEAMLTFIRNEVVRPNFPPGQGDDYVSFFWTQFLFVLFCNLLGMIPFMGSPTASIWVTGGLAICSFVMMHGVSIAKVGVGNYLKSMWPKIEAPYIGWAIACLIFALELLGSVIKSGVLAVRLFANMFAGHMVLATILSFIWAVNFYWLWPVITVTSVFGVVALSLLELFIAFLQAYVFTYLTAVFVGMALQHAEHTAHGDHEPAEAGHEPAHGASHPAPGHAGAVGH
jgi:F-type H+-transporting ATPase subunit a